MNTDLVHQFTEALARVHADRDVEPIAGLFADNAALAKLGREHDETGPEGARQFWRAYRDNFDTIEAEFSHQLLDDETAALEWQSRGTLAGTGNNFTYQGVSLLDADGDKINAFRTYYDPSIFEPNRPATD